MSVNFSTTTPAAPAGGTNVTFQTDGSGNVSAYINAATEIVGNSVNLTAQTANIGAATLLAAPSGLYRIAAYIIITTAGSVSSTLPSVVITWTDGDNGQAQTNTLTPTSAGNTLTTYQQGDCVVNAGVAANINYSTTGYASSAAGMQYALHIRIEKL